MKDVRKTKAQLIEVLDDLRGENTELRKRVTGADGAGVERQLAVERVRAEAMAMRSSKDLLKVLGTLWEEMLNLGIDSVGNTIRFLEEGEDGCHIVRRYYAFHNPRKFGISWTSPDVFEFSEQVVVAEISLTSSRDEIIIDSLRQGEVFSQNGHGETRGSKIDAVTAH